MVVAGGLAGERLLVVLTGVVCGMVVVSAVALCVCVLLVLRRRRRRAGKRLKRPADAATILLPPGTHAPAHDDCMTSRTHCDDQYNRMIDVRQ